MANYWADCSIHFLSNLDQTLAKTLIPNKVVAYHTRCLWVHFSLCYGNCVCHHCSFSCISWNIDADLHFIHRPSYFLLLYHHYVLDFQSEQLSVLQFRKSINLNMEKDIPSNLARVVQSRIVYFD